MTRRVKFRGQDFVFRKQDLRHPPVAWPKMLADKGGRTDDEQPTPGEQPTLDGAGDARLEAAADQHAVHIKTFVDQRRIPGVAGAGVGRERQHFQIAGHNHLCTDEVGLPSTDARRRREQGADAPGKPRVLGLPEIFGADAGNLRDTLIPAVKPEQPWRNTERRQQAQPPIDGGVVQIVDEIDQVHVKPPIGRCPKKILSTDPCLGAIPPARNDDITQNM